MKGKIRIVWLNAYECESYKRINRGGVETARTIKAQYWKNALANFIRRDGMGATGVIHIYETD